ncbi:MAG TPA: cysteine dioxygenase family protein [Vicinamibacterales bacterium]|nr:cysteine dioxygenase family protein [Vicinamibacterales bacterium]
MSNRVDGQLSGTVTERLDAVIHGDLQPGVPELVKAVLIDSMRSGTLSVPDRFKTPRPDTYARRLLHRDPRGRYTIVVMTWGPGQKTALHDHAGIWCVECVMDGKMEVAQFDLTSEQDGAFRFEERTRVMAGRGSAGCLIPPFEYHTLGNAAESASITLHVYGGEMDHCHVFEPAPDGSYRRQRKDLSYHD